MGKYKCFLCPKMFQSENDLKRHAKKIHGIELCEDCLMQEATERCEKGSHLCQICMGIHIRDGHIPMEVPNSSQG